MTEIQQVNYCHYRQALYIVLWTSAVRISVEIEVLRAAFIIQARLGCNIG